THAAPWPERTGIRQPQRLTGILIDTAHRHETSECSPRLASTSSLDFSAGQPDTDLPRRPASWRSGVHLIDRAALERRGRRRGNIQQRVERVPPPRDDRIRAPAFRLEAGRVYGGLTSEDSRLCRCSPS